MKVVVDRDLCQGHGVCESEAPEIFELEKKATTITVKLTHIDESHRDALELAVRYCPTAALKIQEED